MSSIRIRDAATQFARHRRVAAIQVVAQRCIGFVYRKALFARARYALLISKSRNGTVAAPAFGSVGLRSSWWLALRAGVLRRAFSLSVRPGLRYGASFGSVGRISLRSPVPVLNLNRGKLPHKSWLRSCLVFSRTKNAA